MPDSVSSNTDSMKQVHGGCDGKVATRGVRSMGAKQRANPMSRASNHDVQTWKFIQNLRLLFIPLLFYVYLFDTFI